MKKLLNGGQGGPTPIYQEVSTVFLTDIIAMLLTTGICSAVWNDIGPFVSNFALFYQQLSP